MNLTRNLATAVTTAALLIGAGNAAANDRYSFPSANGVSVAAAPAPTFVATGGHAKASVVTSFGQHEPPLPPPVFAYAPSPAPYAGRLMSHALMVAPYANYAADYARLFAPNQAVTAWTDRVFGFVESGYGAVDGWTAAAYGMPRIPGPRRRAESAPDLSPMPTFRAHPELQSNPVFRTD